VVRRLKSLLVLTKPGGVRDTETQTTAARPPLVTFVTLFSFLDVADPADR
jgi:hypothetical protein